MSIDLSIIIVGWNTRDYLKQCLDSVAANPPDCVYEVWIVDNASSDESVSMVQSCFPEYHLIENKKNVGFAAANNQALEMCSGSFILLLNPDTIVKPDTLNHLLNYMKEHPQVGGTGPRLLHGDGSFQTSCYPFPTLSREFLRLFHLYIFFPRSQFDLSKWDYSKPMEVDSIQGACLLLRKEVVDQVGLFDERFFLYSEEIDLCYQIKRADWGLVWLPEVCVIHFGGQSSKQVATKSFINLYQGKMMFFRKNYGKINALFYRLLLMAATLTRLVLSPLAWLEPPFRRRIHLRLANNYFQLLKVLFCL